MAKKRGIHWAVRGLVVGISLGLLLMLLQHVVAGQLINLLRDELSKACEQCELTTRSQTFSFLTFDAKAFEATIWEKGEKQVVFEEIRADFSAERLRKDTVLLLKRLELLRGDINQADPESTAYRFVRSLAEPIDPSRDRPGRLRVKMLALDMLETEILQSEQNLDARAFNSNLRMARPTTDGDFTFDIDVESLRISRADTKPLVLGALTARIETSDEIVFLEEVKLTKADSELLASLEIDGETGEGFTGFVRGRLNPTDFHRESFLSGTVEIEGGVFLNNNEISSEISIRNSSSLSSRLDNEEEITFTSLAAIAKLSHQESKPLSFNTTVSALDFQGFSLERPADFTLVDNQLQGELQLSSSNAEILGASLTSSELDIDLAGTIEQPDVRASLSFESLAYEDFTIGKSVALAQLQGDAISAKGTIFQNTPSPVELEARYGFKEKIGFVNGNFNDITVNEFFSASLFKPELSLRGSTELLFFPGNLSHSSQLSLFSVDKRQFSLDVTGDKEEVSISLKDVEEQIDLEATLNLNTLRSPSTFLELSAKDFVAERLFDDPFCLRSSFSAKIFPANLNQSSASIASLSAGCEPYRFSLSEPSSVSFSSRTARLSDTKLRNENGQITVRGAYTQDGKVSAESDFDIGLEILLPLLAEIDSLGGNFEGSISAEFDGGTPSFEGNASLQDGFLASEQLDLSLQSIGAEIEAEGDAFRVRAASGRVNSGDFTLEGLFYPLHPKDNTLRLVVRDFVMAPGENFNAVIDGSLELIQPPDTQSLLKGAVLIRGAEYRQEFDLREIIQLLTSKALERLLGAQRSTEESEKEGGRDPANIDLDMSISIPGNFFISTDFLSTELSGDLKVTGNLEEPAVEGVIRSVRGWIGFQNQSFQITSGEIEFVGDRNAPELNVTAEQYVPNSLGDDTLVFLEVSGPLAQPDIKLLSDTGLSESEILELLSSGFGGEASRLRNRQLSASSVKRPLERYNEGSLSLLAFLRSLTRVDSINVEPAFNLRRGAVEPAVVARKELSEDLSLKGRAFLSSADSQGSAFAELRLGERISISAGVDAEVTQENSSLAVDISYEAIKPELERLDIEIESSGTLSTYELRSLAGINRFSKLRVNRIEALRVQVENSLRNLGYLDAEVEAQCLETPDDLECSRLALRVNEGPLVTIADLSFSGELTNAHLFTPDLRRLIGEPASSKTREEIERTVVSKLRNDGFIAARASLEFERVGSTFAHTTVEVMQGKPVQFQINGNQQFSTRELLETINLFTRKQPFGKNTPRILTSNIERLYREEGFLLVNVRLSEQESSEDGREIFQIQIDEGPQVTLSEVKFDGLESLPLSELRGRIESRYGGEISKGIFEPSTVIEEEVESVAVLLSSEIKLLGFPDASVESRILLSEEGTKGAIHYTVIEGTPRLFSELSIAEGLEEFLAQEVAAPFSEPQLEDIKESILSALHTRGHKEAQVELELDYPRAHISGAAGPLATIGTVSFEGLARVPEEKAQELIQRIGTERYSSDTSLKLRSSLLRSGLFSSVEIKEEINEEQNIDFIIKVRERALQSLTVGAGANSELGLHAFGETLDRSLFLDGRTLSFRLDGYFEPSRSEVSQGIASLRFFDPEVFGRDIKFSEELRFQDIQLNTLEFDLNRVSLTSTFLSALPYKSSLSFGHTIFQESLEDVAPGAIIGPHDQGTVDLSFINLSITTDHRDSPFNPTRGWLLSLETTTSLEEILSDTSYFGADGEATFLFPYEFFGQQLVFASRSRFGRYWSFGDHEPIPISQRYYLGGRNSVRGFRENSLGPLGADGAVIGGEILLSQNIEAQWRVNDFLALSTFFDAGSVFLSEDEISSRELRESIGIGARVITPFGPLGIDIGHPIDERSGEPSLRFHFSIGSVF